MVQTDSLWKLPAADVQCYAYAVDTALWRVANYADAVNGIITSATDPAERLTSPYAAGAPYEADSIGEVLRMSLDGGSFMIISVDKRDSLYAWTLQPFVAGIPQIYVTQIFHPEKTGNAYTEGGWQVRNDFYTIPDTLNVYLQPLLETEQDGEQSYVTEQNQFKAYAFLADTTSWKVRSYTDAMAQTITSTAPDSTRPSSPDFHAYSDPTSDEGMWSMKIISSERSLNLFVVVVDPADSLYAYSQQNITDMKAGTLTIPPVIFRSWQTDRYIITEDGGWRVVNENYAVEPPETELKHKEPARR